MDNQDLHITRQAATLRLMVEEKLRAAIAKGLFKPGQRLVERELCELIGVGRTSIREALRQLEAEGLVQTIPHRGPIVSSISAQEARQLYEIRALLEGYAGRQFAERNDPQAVKELDKTVKALVKAAKSNEQLALIEAKTQFYKVLMGGADNVFVTQMLTSLHNRITLLRFTSMTQPGRLTRSIVEIRDIYEAIASGDGDAAEKACRLHIQEAAKVALAVLDSNFSEKAPVAGPKPVRAPAARKPAMGKSGAASPPRR
ncbi:GntR family transcriptional regulator [Xanthobacter sp. VNH20]|uniref:GntR family transcriptional regulator n=1 Tax=Xanthobacter sp. VNH20 TaxID=3156616 RepID=UPI0032B3F19D